MSQLSVVLPQQRLSYKEKIKDDFKWSKQCIEAISIRMYQYNSNDNHYSTDIQRKLSNYGLYNNQVDQSDFERECNPFGLTSEEFQDKIQPYNKTYNKINVLLGEELKRPFNIKTFLVNSYAVNAYTRKKKELTRDYVNSQLNTEIEKLRTTFMQAMQGEENQEKLQQEVQQKIDEVLSPEQIEKYMKTEWRDGVEIMMDQLLQWFNRKLRIRKKKNDGFKHACIAGEEFIWVGVVNGQPTLRLCNPIKQFFHKSSEVEYVQDGYYAGYRTRMTPGDILDEFGDDLTEEQKEKVDRMQTASSLYGITTDFLKPEITLNELNKSLEWRMTKGAAGLQNIGSYGPSTLNDVDVVHCEWRSQRKFGFLKYIDEDGKEQLDLVDEAFTTPDTATKVKFTDRYGNKKTKSIWIDEAEVPFELEWTWLPEVWEGTRISGDIYVNMRPKPYQARSLSDPFKVKLGYHGLVYNAMNAPSIAPMDRMKPFQYLYFIVMHKMKQILATDKPPLMNIDMSMIPKTLTEEQWMYYYNQGLGFYDPNQNNAGNPQNVSGQKGPAFVEQRSVMQHVNNYIQILAALDEQINDAAGVTRQREGQTSANEAVTNAQQNITQSSHITEILFQAHNSLWEEVYTSLIETAQLCYKDDPKKIPVVLDDMSRAIIELNPEYLTDAEMGAFIVDDISEAQNLETIRNKSLEFIQNGSTISDIAKLYRATSMSQIQREAEAIERARQQAQQAQEQAQLQHEKDMQEYSREVTEDQQQHEIELTQMKIDGDLQKAAIMVYSRQESMDSNGDNIPDPLQAAELQHKMFVEEQKLKNEQDYISMEKQKETNMKQEKEKDRKLKKEEIKSKEKIARQRPKPSSK